MEAVHDYGKPDFLREEQTMAWRAQLEEIFDVVDLAI